MELSRELLDMRLEDALKVLSNAGHGFLVSEFSKTITKEVAAIAGKPKEPEQRQSTTVSTLDQQDDFEALIQARGYSFPPNSR